MTEQTWIDPKLDRSEWGAGDWDSEPDKVQWEDAATGLVCLARRSPGGGNWCGYVGVPSGHPWHGKSYNDDALIEVEVHGGLTYSNACGDGPIETSICHLPAHGSEDHLWWFGFDCHHAWDFAPAFMVRMRKYPGYGDDCSYKALPYVRHECTELARQIGAALSI